MMPMVLKYVAEGAAVGIVSMILSAKRGKSSRPDFMEASIVALVAMAVFFVLDQLAPRVGSSSRLGVGVAVGSNLVDGISMKKTVAGAASVEGFSGTKPSQAEGQVPARVMEGAGLPSAFDSSSAMSSMAPF